MTICLIANSLSIKVPKINRFNTKNELSFTVIFRIIRICFRVGIKTKKQNQPEVIVGFQRFFFTFADSDAFDTGCLRE